jgi:transglutaminase-like putative cysteine protease
MKRTTVLALILASGALWAGCSQDQGAESIARDNETNPAPPCTTTAVTADIQAGIERYIAEQVERGNGYFDLPYEDGTLRLRLVRVHTEYLANLGPQRQFACVDLVDVGGDIYDVDFFMSGPPGNMTVTETTVHKFNGQPFYTWEQDEDRSWHRVAMENATPGHLGVVNGSDEFEFVYRTTVPDLTESARMWLPVPETDQFQTVKLTSLKVPGLHRFLTDRDHGNQILFLELEPQDSGRTVEIRYQVRRHEKACYAESAVDLGKFLQPACLVPDTDEFRAEAEQVVAGKSSDLVRARALYDHVIDKMRYIKIGDRYGQGDAVYACDSGTGNCTDFHSYFIALARSVDIPARFAIGASIPSARDEGRINGYHCWAEFYADDKWWPVDISEGDKYSSLATYYFGHHPANRVEFSRGRDLVVEPGPAVGSINFLAYPILEIGGETVKIAVEFSFTRPGSAGGSEG